MVVAAGKFAVVKLVQPVKATMPMLVISAPLTDSRLVKCAKVGIVGDPGVPPAMLVDTVGRSMDTM